MIELPVPSEKIQQKSSKLCKWQCVDCHSQCVGLVADFSPSGGNEFT